SKAPSARLRVRAKRERSGILSAKRLHNLCPEEACSTHLGNFHEVVFPLCPEEGQARGERINLNTCLSATAEVFKAVCQSIGHFQVITGTCFLHLIAGDGYR